MNNIRNESVGGVWDHEDHGVAEEKYGDTRNGSGISARINTYRLGTFSWEMVIFTERGTIDVDEIYGDAVDVEVGTIKFSITTVDTSSPFCMDITANDEEQDRSQQSQNASSFTLAAGAFRLDNPEMARCDGSRIIAVSPTKSGNTICYAFGRCDGQISYDPFVYYEGEEGEATETETKSTVENTVEVDMSLILLIIGCIALCICVCCCVAMMFCRRREEDMSKVRSLSNSDIRSKQNMVLPVTRIQRM